MSADGAAADAEDADDGTAAITPPLAASEYPMSIDALLPAIHQQQFVNKTNGGGGGGGGKIVSPSRCDLFDLATAPAAIRHNSIHRHSLSTRTIAHYCRLEQIGEGTYGQVYRAEALDYDGDGNDNKTMVALKKIRLHHPGYMGIPPTVIREIKILKKLQHPCLVKMYEVVSSKGAEALDWEDEREDERRKKETSKGGGGAIGGGGGGGGGAGNSASLPSSLAARDNAEVVGDVLGVGGSSSSKAAKEKKGMGALLDSTAVVAPKKKKKDSMSDLEKLRESYKGNLFLVLEYISHDLTGLLDMAYKFTEVQTKSITKQLLEVLEFMHLRNYVHRDLKSSNVLITDKYEVKLADFGLARCLDSSSIGRMGGNEYGSNASSNEGEYTNKVITLWYRPPELLLGETKYGTAVDIWSAGCILAEVILGRPIFTGKTDMDQLKLIFDLIGTPTERSWEGFGDLKLIRTGEVTIDRATRPKLREKYHARIRPATALDLMEKMLELDPKKRFTASGALRHRYFQSEPVAPEDARELGTIDLGGENGAGYHEFQTKKRRREAKAVAKTAEEEAKARGESVEKQKEAFDRAYRNHLKKGAAGAEIKKEDSAPWQQSQQQPSREQERQSRPWEECQEQPYQHPKQRRSYNREDDPSSKRGRYHHSRTTSHGGSKEGMENIDAGEGVEPVMFVRDGGHPKGSLDQNGRRLDDAGDRPGHPSAPPPGRQYDKYGNPVGDNRMPGGPDRNMMLHGQDAWGEQRGRDRWGSRPPDWGGPPRGARGRGGWSHEQGRHPGGWPRNG